MASSSAPVQTNTLAQIVGGFIQALMTGGEDVAVAYLEAQVPWLAWPVISGILSWVVGQIGSAVQTALINSATGAIIAGQTAAEESAMVNAATALQMAQQSGDPAAIATALANAKTAYAGVVSWDGTYSAP